MLVLLYVFLNVRAPFCFSHRGPEFLETALNKSTSYILSFKQDKRDWASNGSHAQGGRGEVGIMAADTAGCPICSATREPSRLRLPLRYQLSEGGWRFRCWHVSGLSEITGPISRLCGAVCDWILHDLLPAIMKTPECCRVSGQFPSLARSLSCCREDALPWRGRLCEDSRSHVQTWFMALSS